MSGGSSIFKLDLQAINLIPSCPFQDGMHTKPSEKLTRQQLNTTLAKTMKQVSYLVQRPAERTVNHKLCTHQNFGVQKTTEQTRSKCRFTLPC
jgi:hypothetical protein